MGRAAAAAETEVKRTGFTRKPGKVYATLTRTAPMKSTCSVKVKRRKRVTKAEGGDYLDACRGECCYLRIGGVCRLDPEDKTVVPCHSNLQEHGKGLGLRAKHEFTFPGCDLCHYWLDQSKAPSKEERRVATLAALERWVPVRTKKMEGVWA